MGKLADMVAYEFDPGVRRRGTAYLRDGVVRIRETGPQEVLAKVQGSRAYNVWLFLNETLLFATCECPYYGDVGICKHVWATVLAADEAGHLRLPEGTTILGVLRISDLTAEERQALSLRPPFAGSGDDDEYVAPDDSDLDDDILDDYDEDERCPIDDDVEDDWDEEAGDSSTRDWIGMPEARQAFCGATSGRPCSDETRHAKWRWDLSHLKAELGEPDRYLRARLQPSCRLLYVLDVPSNLPNLLSLQVDVSQRLKNGSWSAARKRWRTPELVAAMEDPEDLRIYALLTGARDAGWWNGASYTGHFVLAAGLLDTLMPALCRTGRFFVKTREEGQLTPLRLEEGAPWAFRIEVGRDDKSREYVLRGVLQKEETRRDLSDAVTLNGRGWVVWPDCVARLSADEPTIPWMHFIHKKKQLRVPVAKGLEFRDQLCTLPGLPPLDMPDELRLEEVSITPRPLLRLITDDQRSPQRRAKVQGDLLFDYDGELVPAIPPSPLLLSSDRNRAIRRDRTVEDAAFAMLATLGLEYPYGALGPELTANRVPMVVRTLLTQGWRVEAEGKLYRQPGPFKIDVSSSRPTARCCATSCI